MTDPAYAQMMARYNCWQNDNLLTAADELDDDSRRSERGAFFGSIEKTFSHLLWADRIWLGRFSDTALPTGGISDSTGLIGDWEAFRQERMQMDRRILDWASHVAPDWFEGDLTWHSGALGRQITRPRAELVVQLFNHQTHHRGQIHAMLTAAGARPSDTDLPFMPEIYRN
ncbi:DinB family protein [Paracoccus zhejiangensis]|uniref:Damage-inducible protein DinB n=1 Tax=Paracoccus zhejiangensis TaxID=1077935 RepID=A0A2H5EUZ5_9RHOB|nr:DinB family protein [Paracoccus zhejiangensis]AUH63119.1 damage-inducible protein DinB [Paracoccus zhejiangensis]